MLAVAIVLGLASGQHVRIRAPCSPARVCAGASAAGVAALAALWHPLAAQADVTAGKQIFEAKCAACHEGGGIVIPFSDKTLAKEALQKYGYAEQGALVSLISKGKGQMPAYGEGVPDFLRLNDEQIADVAEYVLKQAASGW